MREVNVACSTTIQMTVTASTTCTQGWANCASSRQRFLLEAGVALHLNGVHAGVSGIVDPVRAARWESYHIARPDWEPAPVAVSAA